MQRRRAVDLGGVRVDARVEEVAHADRVASLHGVGHWRGFGAWSGTAKPDEQENESTDASAAHMSLLHVTTARRDRRGLRLFRCCRRTNRDGPRRDRAA